MKGPFLFRLKGWVMVVRALATLMDEVIFKIKGGVMRCLSGYGKIGAQQGNLFLLARTAGNTIRCFLAHSFAR